MEADSDIATSEEREREVSQTVGLVGYCTANYGETPPAFAPASLLRGRRRAETTRTLEPVVYVWVLWVSATARSGVLSPMRVLQRPPMLPDRASHSE